MFKRVLVLVLFLFGVFWWLTSRDENPETPAIDTEVVSEENTEAETEGESTDDEEDSETEASGETNDTAETSTPVEAEAETTSEGETTTTNENTTTATNTNTQTPTVTVTPPVVTTPATNPQPTVTTPAPVVVTPQPPAPTVPDRITNVRVFVYEWGLDLSDKTIPAGTINFQVQNDGRFTHDFSIRGFGNLGKVTPSEQLTFTIKLPAGEYEAFSDRRQDYERGITETFTVVE